MLAYAALATSTPSPWATFWVQFGSVAATLIASGIAICIAVASSRRDARLREAREARYREMQAGRVFVELHGGARQDPGWQLSIDNAADHPIRNVQAMVKAGAVHGGWAPFRDLKPGGTAHGMVQSTTGAIGAETPEWLVGFKDAWGQRWEVDRASLIRVSDFRPSFDEE